MERKSLFTHFIECFTQNYFNLSGRARRREYWGSALFFVLLCMLLGVIGGLTLGAQLVHLLHGEGVGDVLLSFGGGMLVLLVLGLIYLICLFPILAVQVRRLHDRGMSGWWVLCSIVLGLFQGLVEQISPDSIAFWIISVVYWALELYLFVQTLMDGEVGANKYGEDPKAAERGLL